MPPRVLKTPVLRQPFRVHPLHPDKPRGHAHQNKKAQRHHNAASAHQKAKGGWGKLEMCQFFPSHGFGYKAGGRVSLTTLAGSIGNVPAPSGALAASSDALASSISELVWLMSLRSRWTAARESRAWIFARSVPLATTDHAISETTIAAIEKGRSRRSSGTLSLGFHSRRVGARCRPSPTFGVSSNAGLFLG